MEKAKAAKTAIKSKNDPTTRGKVSGKKQYNSQTVVPTLYVGTQVGKGKYIAAQNEGDGKLVYDPLKPDTPLSWKKIN